MPSFVHYAEIWKRVLLRKAFHVLLAGNVIPVHASWTPVKSFSRNFSRVSPAGERTGTVEVVEYEWGADAQHLLAGRNSAGNANATGGTGYGVVICADCVYAGASVEPLLASLCEVGNFIWCVCVRIQAAGGACCPTRWLKCRVRRWRGESPACHAHRCQHPKTTLCRFDVYHVLPVPCDTAHRIDCLSTSIR